jgi:hypothetical protein
VGGGGLAGRGGGGTAAVAAARAILPERRRRRRGWGPSRSPKGGSPSCGPSGGPVFLYFTADWCITCKVNESGALASAQVASAFSARGVRVLEGRLDAGRPRHRPFP